MKNTEIIPIPLRGVNAFLVKGDKPILIDAGNKGDDGQIIEALEKNGVSPEDLSLILLTHCHTDHFGSLAAIKRKTSAKVAIHEAEADNLSRGVNTDLTSPHLFGRLALKLVGPVFNKPGDKVNPDVVISGELDLEPYGVKGRVFPTPGHTPGSLTVEIDGDVIVGDLIFGSGSGWVMPTIIAYDKNILQKSIRQVLDLQPKRIFASHGGPFQPDRVRKRFLSN